MAFDPGALLAAFPGIVQLPHLHTAPDVALHPCTGCGNSPGAHVHSTALVNDAGEPWHEHCYMLHLGLIGEE